jgi:uncharacterized RDD family membrane protein YckC
MKRRTGTLVIRTPEGISFALLLAGPISRFLAWAVDLAVVTAGGIVLGMVLGALDVLSPDLSRAALALAYFVLPIAYGIGLEWGWRGQTLGKRLLRLRVMDAQGLRLQFSQVATRNLLRFVDLLPACYLVGGVVSLLNPRAQRLGDVAANTIVVRHPRRRPPDWELILAGKYNSLRDHPHLVARLRQRTAPEEARVALRAVLRRDELDPEARVRLLAELADHYRRAAGIPAEIAEDIADEQLLRNVVDVLFRPNRSTSSQTTAAPSGAPRHPHGVDLIGRPGQP